MSWDANKQRCQKIYFGEPLGLKPTRREVGEFIMNEMGLVYDEDPAWSEGVPELVDMGMQYWNLRLENTTPETLEEVEAERDELRKENTELSKELADRRKQIKSERAVDRLQYIEASILKVLCQEGDRGEDGLGFVEVPTVVQNADLQYSTVVTYLNKLTRPEFGGHVEYVEAEAKAKAMRESVFEEYCRRARITTPQAD